MLRPVFGATRASRFNLGRIVGLNGGAEADLGEARVGCLLFGIDDFRKRERAIHGSTRSRSDTKMAHPFMFQVCISRLTGGNANVKSLSNGAPSFSKTILPPSKKKRLHDKSNNNSAAILAM